MADAAGLIIGEPQTGLPTSAPAFSNGTVSASNAGVGFVFQALNANAITGFKFRYGARTGTPPTFVATIEGVSASTGFPDGADVGGASPTAVTFTPPADATWDGTQRSVTFTNAYTPSRGQRLAITIRHSSGTIDGSNNSSFTTEVQNFVGGNSTASHPYALRLSAGTWGKRTTIPVFGVATASEVYGNPMSGLYATNSAGTDGHRHALKFTIPANLCSTFKVRGVMYAASIAGSTGINPILGLWSAGGLIQDVTLDSDIEQVASSNYVFNLHYFNEATLTALDAGTAYYVGLQVAGSSRVCLNGFQLAASADLAAYPGGSNWHFATYNGASWTDDQTVRPFVGLILDDMSFTGGGGGGGLIIAGGGGLAGR